MINLKKQSIPNLSGVYFFKNKDKKIIYIGKAKSLKKRINSYFNQQSVDWKINLLLQEYDSIDWILTKNEEEALLLEASLIKDFQPKFNILLKSGQPFVYLLFSESKKGLSKLELVRNKKKEGFYFGPFINKRDARAVYFFLIETFQLFLCNKKIINGCLDYHLGVCAGFCLKVFDKESYLFRLKLAQNFLKSNKLKIIKDLKQRIKIYTKNLEFEKAKQLYNYLENITSILSTIKRKFSQEKFFNDVFIKTVNSEINFHHLQNQSKQLASFLNLKNPVNIIDCFDISHFQSHFIVGSTVRFVNGKPDKSNFRHFKIRTLKQQNDYAALQEIVKRRYKKEKPENYPDLILIDGGKGQLNAVKHIYPSIPFVSLAKKEETIFSDTFLKGKTLDLKTKEAQLLIALRDYAHHFAVSYHKLLRKKFY